MIELTNVSKYYNNNGVVTLGLRNINLNFDKNEIVAIVGESGSGKSTLLNVICGVDSYEEGEILFNGYETSYFNQEDMDTFRRLNVSFIYQNYNIIDSYTVLENVMFPLLINGLTKKEAKARALELIERVGLSHRVNNRGVKLSGGEKQRCVIARALATNSPILACDEPTGNLDSKTGEDIIKLIKEVAEDKLVLIVTHNYEQVEGIVTRTIKMADGEVVSDSNVNNKVTEEAKDGEIFDNNVKKLKYQTIALIGGNNLRRTPKKNIFIFLVLFVLSIIGLFLFGQSYASSIESEYNSIYGFNNTLRERIIIYDSNHNAFNPESFNGYENYINAFYEDSSCFITNKTNDFYFYESVYFSAHMPLKLKDKQGVTEIGENQGYLVLPSTSYYDSYTLNAIIESRSLYASVYNNSVNIDVVGIAKSEEISSPLLITNKDFIVKYVNNGFFSATLDVTYSYSDVVAEVTGKTLEIYYSDILKPRISLNQASYDYISDIVFDVPKMSMYKKTLKLEDCDILYSQDEEKIELPYGYFDDTCYELTVYSDKLDAVIRIANSNNLNYIIPSKSGQTLLSFSFIVFLVSIIFSSLVMIFLVFISYTVLQRVYQSRSKDYTIMRSLGMMRPQMAKMIRFEVLTLGLISAIFAIIALGITFLLTKESADMNVAKAIFSPTFLIIYLILMFLFDLRLANKFNKKLFKFSVTKTIKEVF